MSAFPRKNPPDFRYNNLTVNKLFVEQPILELVREHGAQIPTPYYLIDEIALKRNMDKIAHLRDQWGISSVLALKCFSTWAVFEMMKPSLEGTTSSSLFEARLGHQKFGKEVHAYSVAWSEAEIKEVRKFATKIIFNSLSQLRRLGPLAAKLPVGLRINPGVSHSEFDLADPARRYCRLGERDLPAVMEARSRFNGAMFHCQCENDRFDKFCAILDRIGQNWAPLLKELDWVSLGGGIYFTKEGYPLEEFGEKIAEFGRRFDVKVYLEPGETAITQSGYLVTRVLDIVSNELDIAVVDAAVETHLLDFLIYGTEAKILPGSEGPFRYQIAGRTCLAGDVFGTYNFPQKLEVGSLVTFADVAGYSNVKKNWFNGIPMPAIVVRRLNGRVEVVKEFHYEDYVGSLS